MTIRLLILAPIVLPFILAAIGMAICVFVGVPMTEFVRGAIAFASTIFGVLFGVVIAIVDQAHKAGPVWRIGGKQ